MLNLARNSFSEESVLEICDKLCDLDMISIIDNKQRFNDEKLGDNVNI